jgi:hypothetical protein
MKPALERSRPPALAFALALATAGLAPVAALRAAPYELPPIRYHETEPDTKLTRLFEDREAIRRISQGGEREVLAALLEALEVPVESQVLVYSKTSEQNSRISPRTPRAIYFSDDLYIGWVQGGEIEAASFDPVLGMVFHLVTLTGRGEIEGVREPIALARDRGCLSCHASSATRQFPGLLVRSVYPQESGLPLFEAGSFQTRHHSPIAERWGGWYVTGEVEHATHLGNAIASKDPASGEIRLEPLAEGFLDDLGGLFRADRYLHGGRSDALALMVLEHQVAVHNVLVEANLTARITRHRHEEIRRAFGESPDDPLDETNERILDSLADRVLREMLYRDEFPLPSGVRSGGGFEDAFAANRRVHEGRSLKDFRLHERLMKFRCSHLIHSEAFQHLPDEMRDRILTRLHEILAAPSPPADYAHLSASERRQLLAILGATLGDLPPAWGEIPGGE